MVETFDPQTLGPGRSSPFLKLGFRPFFLFAGIFAVLGMAQWALIYHGVYAFQPGKLTLFQWHAHEMIFGYTTAVIAGFLLTSVRNWTDQQTPFGTALGVMVTFWVMSRAAFAIGETAIVFGVLCNLCFMIGLFWGTGSRIFRVRQWRQAGIMGVLAALTLAETGVLAGLLQQDQRLISRAVYGGFYLVVMLILIMGRRVIPFFIERGVGYPCSLKQSRLLDIAVMLGFASYGFSELFNAQQGISSAAAVVVLVAHSARLVRWHTAGIWRKPLLWSLYLSQIFLLLGLLMAVAKYWLPVPAYLVLHAFALGGVGFITLSMMSRVSLGHTGRDVHNPPGVVRISLVVMIMAILARVALPIVAPLNQVLWIGLSQLFWIVAFGLFLVQYLPILISPRIDGRDG